jgi:hypothetical protein
VPRKINSLRGDTITTQTAQEQNQTYLISLSIMTSIKKRCDKMPITICSTANSLATFAISIQTAKIVLASFYIHVDLVNKK